MNSGIDLTGTFVRRVASIPAIGYPLLLSWQKGWVPGPKATVEVRFKDGMLLHCDLSDKTQRTMALGLFEPAESRLIREILRPRDTFIDVGAHIGWFTTIASRCVGRDGKVIACEPYPTNFSTLKENIVLNGADNVQLIEMALGRRAGSLSLGGADSGAITALDWGQSQRIEARMTTLDQVAADVEAVALIKMDVEGWETDILSGGDETLARAQHVLFEINRPALSKVGSSPEELYDLLRKSGFKTFASVAQRGLRRLLRPDDLNNVLASK